MRLFKWLRGESKSAGISRRDFFARFIGRHPGAVEPPEEVTVVPVVPSCEVEAFAYHAGPDLLPTIRPGQRFELQPDPPHISDPRVRVYLGRSLLGYLPPENTATILDLITAGAHLRCRALSIDPSADPSRPLAVEISRVERASVSSGR